MSINQENVKLEELIAKYISGRCNNQEEDLVKKLLIENEEAKELYTIYKKLYDSSIDFNFYDQKAFKEFVQKSKKEKPIDSTSKINFLKISVAVAASILLLLGITYFS